MKLIQFDKSYINLHNVDSITKSPGLLGTGELIEIYISGQLYIESFLSESERDFRFETLIKLIENA